MVDHERHEIRTLKLVVRAQHGSKQLELIVPGAKVGLPPSKEREAQRSADHAQDWVDDGTDARVWRNGWEMLTGDVTPESLSGHYVPNLLLVLLIRPVPKV
jgi:hypothetical protein